MAVSIGTAMPQPSALLSVTPTAKPVESTPVPHSADAVHYDGAEWLIEHVFAQGFVVDLSALQLNGAGIYTTEFRKRRSTILGLPGRVEETADAAFRWAVQYVLDTLGYSADEVTFECGDVSWRALAAMSWSYGNEELQRILQDVCILDVDFSNGRITGRLTIPEFDELNCSEDLGLQYIAETVYFYCMTVLDDNMNNRMPESREYSEEFLASLVMPLRHMRFRNSWYHLRSGGARVHLGMDIGAPADTEIYSCSSGTVKYVGSSRLSGNYVVITDEYGYDYHYYHMIRLSDFLTVGQQVGAGELIGHVGNTGNSASNHLHLSIIGPDDCHVNPYRLLRLVNESGG